MNDVSCRIKKNTANKRKLKEIDGIFCPINRRKKGIKGIKLTQE